MAALAASIGVLTLGALPRAALAARPYDLPPDSDAHKTVPPPPTGYLEDSSEAGLVFSYHPSAGERVRALIKSIGRMREALSKELGQTVLAQVEIRVAAVPDEMRTLGPTEDVPGYAPALVFPRQKLIVTSLGSPRSLEPPDLEATLRHALGHLALDEALDHRPVPIWLHEGYAVHVAGDTAGARGQALLLASLRKRLIDLPDLEASFPADAPESSLAYAEAADLVRFLMDKPRQASFAAMVRRVREGEPFEKALSGAYESDLGKLATSWRKDLARRYGFLPIFLVGVLAWAVAALVLLARRMRKRRAEAKAPPRRSLRVDRATVTPVERSSRLAVRASVQRAARQRTPVLPEGMGEALPPDADVPKVEHEGQWHTLH
jgi:hypothetical protein